MLVWSAPMVARYPIAACLWGIAVGLFAYRYGLLPLGWTSPWRHVLPGIAIGLSFGGRQLWREARDNGAMRPAAAPLVGAGLLGVALAFGAAYLAFPTLDRTSIAKRAFPGFELAIPSGEIVTDVGDYTSGKLLQKNVGNAGGVVVVQWEPMSPMTPEEMKVIATMLGEALGNVQGEAKVTTLPGPDGKPVDSIVFGGEDATFTLSLLRCGVRHVLVATGAKRDTMGLHERIVASFVCRADPAKEATAEVIIPIVIDLPGWYTEVREPDQIQLTDGLTGNLTMRAVQGDANVPLDKLLKLSFQAAGIDVQVGARDGERVLLTLSEAGEQVHGWARLFKCPRGTAMVLGLCNDQAVADALYREVESARCLRAGEAPQQWPDHPPAPATP